MTTTTKDEMLEMTDEDRKWVKKMLALAKEKLDELKMTEKEILAPHL